MFTPSGRFQPDKKICFSMSDFHPGTVRHRHTRSLSPNLHNNASFRIRSGTQHGVWQQCAFLRRPDVVAPLDNMHDLHRLTGLLSFMLSDEMTTGSVTSADRDKRVLATRSHDWNRKQKRFQDAFPEVRSVPLCFVYPYEHFLTSLHLVLC